MLKRIHIRDLAVVSGVELELAPGMTVLTGETGAGKSILIDALDLVLGGRSDPGMIRAGADKADITATFDLSAEPEVLAWLRDNDLEAGDECILRRVLKDNGSRGYVNGAPAPAKVLQGLGERLVDIHGQHAHQSLLRRDHQRDLLDDYAGVAAPRSATADAFRTWRDTARRLEELRRASQDRAERIDLLRFQVAELEGLGLTAEELVTLEEEHALLANAGVLQNGCAGLVNLLDEGEEAIYPRLAHGAGELADLAGKDPRLAEAQGMLQEAAIQVQEAGRALRHYLDHLDLDPRRLAQVEARMGDIHHISRKYRRPADELPGHLIELRKELDALEHADVHLAHLEEDAEHQRGVFLQAAGKLGAARRRAALELAREIAEGLHTLKMAGARFDVAVEALSEEKATAAGLDRVEFLVSANPGQPLQPLARVASGGELSRISLVIQVATARCSGVSTLIFDEVDVGIGGGVAEVVGRLLRRLGGQRQVLCVTHLPQVASQGHHHLQVSKQTDGVETHTRIRPLVNQERVEEIARMLGGIEITDQTLAHAAEMVGRAAQDG